MFRVLFSYLLAGMVLGAASVAGHATETPSNVVITVPACQLLEARDLESYLGGPAAIRASSGNDSSAGLCLWESSTVGATVEVALFPGSSHGVPEGAERDYFDQMIEAEKAKFRPGEFVAVPELADDAWALDLSDNPTQYFKVYLFKGSDNATISSNGIGLEATVAIARMAAARMK